jgi:hypothetical protein
VKGGLSSIKYCLQTHQQPKHGLFLNGLCMKHMMQGKEKSSGQRHVLKGALSVYHLFTKSSLLYFTNSTPSGIPFEEGYWLPYYW